MINLRTIFERWNRSAVRACTVSLLLAGLAACSTLTSLAPPDMVGVSLTPIGHLGRGIGIPDLTVDGHSGGNNGGWGGGGRTSCCVLLPAKVTQPVMVTVKWSTYRSTVDEERFHEAVVPVHFEVQPGVGGAGLFVHFLPGHRVEVWYAKVFPESPVYPGPIYPRGAAPRYVPIAGEKPALPIASN